MQKFNRESHKYEDYKIPSDWYCPIYSDDMDEIINCVSCGKELPFGDCYTSLEIHNDIGLGYGVCRGCYSEEHFRKYERYPHLD